MLTNAGFGIIGKNIFRSKKAVGASLAIDTRSVPLAFLTDASTFIIAVDVHGQSIGINLWIIIAFVRMPMAIARFTGIRILFCILAPFFLCETLSALVTIDASCIMETLALKQISIISGRRANIGVTIAHTTPTDRYFLNRIIVLKRYKNVNLVFLDHKTSIN